MVRFLTATAVSSVLFSLALPAPAAVLVDFEDYATSEIVGQPSTGTAWTGNLGNFVVQAGIGNSGKGLVNLVGATNSHNLRFKPTASEIGGNWATDKVVTYQFDLSILEHSGSNALYRFYIGESSTQNHAVELQVKKDGGVSLNGGTNFTTLTLGTFHTFKAVVDYANGRYDFFVDSTPYANDNVFDGLTPAGEYPSFRINLVGADGTSRMALDNLSISVPEPTTAVLGAGGLLGLLGRRRRS